MDLRSRHCLFDHGRRVIYCIIATLFALGVAAAEPSLTQEQAAEFRAAIEAAIPEANAIAGDTAAFLARVQPFGALDLVVLKETDPDRASFLRNVFLGVVGRAAGINPGPIANDWHCPPRGEARRDTCRATA